MWIECGIINYKFIIPLIYPALFQIRIIIHKDEEKPFLIFFTNYLGYLFSGLIYLIIKYRMKKVEISDKDKINNNDDETTILDFNEELIPNNDESNEISRSSFMPIKSTFNKMKINKANNQIDLEIEKIEKKNSKRKHLYILILAIIYLVPMLLDAFNTYEFKTSSPVSLFIAIISYVIFSRIILGMKIYSHQIFALIIILVSNIIIILLVIIQREEQGIIDMILNFIIILSIVILYCLYNNLVKKYFNVYMGSPYYLMFIIDAMPICLILPYEIITVIAFGKDTKFNGIFYQMEKNYEKTKLYPLIFIADIISAFLWIAGINLTVYFFTPCHFIISESISQIISTIISQTFENLSLTKQIIIYILFFMIFLGSLIYNEIFIINICSLSENTRKYIIIRQKEETDNIKKDNYKYLNMQ